jgi:hypothetical protein
MAQYMQFSQVTEITNIKRLANSKNGNPRFEITFAGNTQKGKTKTDAGWAYAIHDNMGKVRIKYHFTPARGHCIIDDIESV